MEFLFLFHFDFELKKKFIHFILFMFFKLYLPSEAQPPRLHVTGL